MDSQEKQQRTFSWRAPWLIGAVAWEEAAGEAADQLPRVALASFAPEGSNCVQVLTLDEEHSWLRPGKPLDLPVPAISVLFSPAQANTLVTVGDALRVWSLAGGGTAGGKVTRSLRPQFSEWSVPMTSADCNRTDTELVAVGTMDATVAVYDIQAGQLAYQNLPGEREVTGVAWRDRHTFASTAADGTLRLWDIRRLSAWDDIYCWGQRGVPLQCCSWCPGDSNYVATVAQDSPSVVVLDVRRAGRVGASVLADLALPQGCCNAFAWSPSTPHIMTAGSDGTMLLWDVTAAEADGEGTGVVPLSKYAVKSEINAVAWGQRWKRHVALAFGRDAQVLHI